MDEENKGTETTVVTIPAPEDLEAKVAQLESEKADLLKKAEEGVNYRAAYIKESAKNRQEGEDDDERMFRIAQDALKSSRLAEIAREQDAIIKKALKENSELKRAALNKPDITVSTTTHTEAPTVKDTIITPDQMAQFKAMGKSDKWIENYKKNLSKNR